MLRGGDAKGLVWDSVEDVEDGAYSVGAHVGEVCGGGDGFPVLNEVNEAAQSDVVCP